MSPDPSTQSASRLARRTTLLVTLALGMTGVVGAVISLVADRRESRRQAAHRLVHEGGLLRDALGLHVAMLRVELERLAEHPEILSGVPSADVLSHVRDDRSLFSGGVATYELGGRLRWSDPPGIDVPSPSALSPWHQEVLVTGSAAVDALAADQRMAIAVPVKRGGTLAGVVVGVVGADDPFFSRHGPAGQTAIVLDSQGRSLSSAPPPSWLATEVRRLGAGGPRLIEELGEGDERAAVYTSPVAGSALRLLLMERTSVLAPELSRLDLQFAALSLLMVIATVAFTVVLSGVWRRLEDAETKAARNAALAALGDASSLIAHEVKNSLNGIRAAASLLDGLPEAAPAVGPLRAQADRLGHLARSLLDFATPAAAHLSVTRLDLTARDALAGLETLPEREVVAVALSAEQPVAVQADPLLLVTAIDNLVRNAIEAGAVARDTGQIAAPRVEVRVAVRDGHGVLTVEDNAGGPPPGFESSGAAPFHTTKPRGIGLGLAVVRRAMERQGGALRFERLPGGSRFSLHLQLESS